MEESAGRFMPAMEEPAGRFMPVMEELTRRFIKTKILRENVLRKNLREV